MSAVVYAAPWQRMAVNTRSPYLDTIPSLPVPCWNTTCSTKPSKGARGRSHIASTALPIARLFGFTCPTQSMYSSQTLFLGR
ncbi:hypothetical protein [Hymenobacter sp. BRD67]|uniref:hypothetical protein n=1 Tax=Hymenobacter sp. BRD67 TaxID=2675877 RepID=UPI0015663455|nr:hypothetical protein [Hymenobacter sp. BRD67]QKG55073.1 hypothetical protein GKZ67_21865 [Hymenobacter sp. BRD67]